MELSPLPEPVLLAPLRSLADGLAVVETRGDPPTGALHPDEEACLRGAVNKRREEFAAVRWCARQAFAAIGLPPAPVLPGPRGEPCWPEGVVGSMTHCLGYRAAVVARAARWASLGIDAEPNEPLPPGVLHIVARPEERDGPARTGGPIAVDRLLFSAKESVFKAWYPLTREELAFSAAGISFTGLDAASAVSAAAGEFTAQLFAVGPLVGGRRLSVFHGVWFAHVGLLATAVLVPGT